MATFTKHRILVTGGAGFIGTHLCRTLITQGFDVSVVDLKAPTFPVEGVHYYRGDIRDFATVEFHIKDIEVVFHLAAIVSVPVCQLQPMESYSTNFGGTLAILEAIRLKKERTGKLTSIVFASTAAIYGHLGTETNELNEETISEPFLSFYAAQKHASEQAIRQYEKLFGVPSFIFRFFNVYGKGQDPTSPYSGVMTIFLEKAKAGEPLTIFGDGSSTRDFVEVRDLCKVVAASLSLPVETWNALPVNIGTGNRVRIDTLAQEIVNNFQALANLSDPIRFEPARSGDVQHSLAATHRLKQLFPNILMRPFSKGLSDFIQGY